MKIFKIIYNFVPYQNKSQFIFNKYIFNLYFNLLRKIKVIQIFYRKYRLKKNDLNPDGDNYNPNINYNQINRFLLYRFYILEYPEEYLYKYPYFLVNKLYSNSNSSRSHDLYLWLHNNILIEKKSYVKKFFIENKITSEEIMIAGW